MFSYAAHKNIKCLDINSTGVFYLNTRLNKTVSPELYSSYSGRCITSETMIAQGHHTHTHIYIRYQTVVGVKFLSDTKTKEFKAKLLFLKELKQKQNFLV